VGSDNLLRPCDGPVPNVVSVHQHYNKSESGHANVSHHFYSHMHRECSDTYCHQLPSGTHVLLILTSIASSTDTHLM